jgi:hypothetical protein
MFSKKKEDKIYQDGKEEKRKRKLKEATKIGYDRGYAKCTDILTSKYNQKIQNIKDDHTIETASLNAVIDSLNRHAIYLEGENKRMKKTETEAKILKKQMVQFAKDMDYVLDEENEMDKKKYGTFKSYIDKVLENKLLE